MRDEKTLMFHAGSQLPSILTILAHLEMSLQISAKYVHRKPVSSGAEFCVFATMFTDPPTC